MVLRIRREDPENNGFFTPEGRNVLYCFQNCVEVGELLINNTNREHTTWSREQLEAASEYGDVVDMIMPGLSAEADEAEADRVAGLVVRRILRRLGREMGDEGRTGGVKSPDSTDDPTEAGVTQADSTEAGVTQVDPREAGVAQADSTEAGVTQADSTEAGVTQADSTEAGVAQADPTDGNEEAVAAVRDRAKDAVLCQGDFTLVYRVVTLLKEAGVTVMAPAFQRVTKPTLRPDGTTVPGYSFDFVRFRRY